MSLVSVSNPQLAPDTDSSVHELLVLWQHPDTRRIHPIGRFCFDGTEYTFDYTQHAGNIANFRPLPGLPLVPDTYRASRMPTLFRQRTMSSHRPDFASAMADLGISPDMATPWEQIVHSGGRRAGDTLQFMQMPAIRAGRLHARFLTNGIRHVPVGGAINLDGTPHRVSSEEHERVLSSLVVGQSVEILPERNNPEDENSMVVTSQGVPLGWAPRVLSEGLRALGVTEGSGRTTVVRTAGPTAPPHVRLVIDVEADAPIGFSFDRAGDWDPYRA